MKATTDAALRKYALSGPDGRNTKEAIAYWQQRASENSQIAPRASDHATPLPDTNKPQPVRKA